MKVVIITGLTARLTIAPFFAHPFDVWAWYINGKSLFDGAVYLQSYLVPYQYSYLLFVFPAYFVFGLVSGFIGSYTIPISSVSSMFNLSQQYGITVIPGFVFDFVVKLPLIFSDTLIAMLLYKIVKNEWKSESAAVSASMLWFLNPLVIWVTAGWGMFDTLPALFTVFSLYTLLRRRYMLAGLSLAVAILLKYYAIALVFPILLLSYRRDGLHASLKVMVAGGITEFLLLLPSLGKSLSSFASQAVGQSSTALTYSGLSFWTAITLFLHVPDLVAISTALGGVLLLVAYYWFLKHRAEGPESVVYMFALPILVLLLCYAFVGENFFLWVLPFMSILSLRDSRLRNGQWLLSGVALVSSVTNSLLPYYLLPMYPWIGNVLVAMLQSVQGYRVESNGTIQAGFSVGKVYLAAIGVIAAVLLCLLMIRMVREARTHSDAQSSIGPQKASVSFPKRRDDSHTTGRQSTSWRLNSTVTRLRRDESGGRKHISNVVSTKFSNGINRVLNR